MKKNDIRPQFWESIPLNEMTIAEWEALCDGCGKCCLNKLEYEDTGEVKYTRVACKLLDSQSCRCIHYQERHKFVPQCVTLSAQNIEEVSYWIPQSCAYRLLYEGHPLPDWHPLITHDTESTHRARVSVRGWTISEINIDENALEDYVVERLS